MWVWAQTYGAVVTPPGQMFVSQHQANLLGRRDAILVIISIGYNTGIRGEGVHEGLI